MWRYRIWQWLDRMLILSAVALLAWVLIERYGGQGAPSVGTKGRFDRESMREGQPDARPVAPDVVRKAVPVTGAHPVSLGGPAVLRDDRPVWRERGVRDVEWETLPYAPGMDMVQTERGYVVAFSLPGIRREEIQIDCANGLLAITALFRDIQSGVQRDARRRIRLPADSLTSGTLEQTFSNGVLRVFIPRLAVSANAEP